MFQFNYRHVAIHIYIYITLVSRVSLSKTETILISNHWVNMMVYRQFVSGIV